MPGWKQVRGSFPFQVQTSLKKSSNEKGQRPMNRRCLSAKYSSELFHLAYSFEHDHSTIEEYT